MATTGAEAKRAVVLAVPAATAMTAAATVAIGAGWPKLRIVIGGAVVGAVLLAAADTQPNLVGPFANLLLATSILTAGGAVAVALTRYLSTPNASTGGGSGRPQQAL